MTFLSENTHLLPGHMDHVYISLTEYLWVSWVLRPSAIITTLFGGMIQRGLLGIAILGIMERLGLIKIISDQKAEEKLYNLIMETTLVTWLRLHEGEDDSLVGVFDVPGTFHAFPGGKHWKSSELYIEVNISRRRVLKTFYDNQSISYPDALTLTFLALVGMTHPVIHSYANWGGQSRPFQWLPSKDGALHSEVQLHESESIPDGGSLFQTTGTFRAHHAQNAREVPVV